MADEDTVFSSPAPWRSATQPSLTNKANYGLTLAQAAELSSNTVFGQLGRRSRWALTSWSPEPRASASTRRSTSRCTRPNHALGRDLQKESWELAGSRRREPVGTPRAPAASPWPPGTVLEMAMVGTAIANDGVIMQPCLVDSVNSANGERGFSASPTKLMQAVSKTTAGRVGR